MRRDTAKKLNKSATDFKTMLDAEILKTRIDLERIEVTDMDSLDEIFKESEAAFDKVRKMVNTGESIEASLRSLEQDMRAQLNAGSAEKLGPAKMLNFAEAAEQVKSVEGLGQIGSPMVDSSKKGGAPSEKTAPAAAASA